MSHAVQVPEVRIRRINDAPIAAGGDCVVYWMTAARRLRYNFALQRAVELCHRLGVPLVVFEPLRAGYQWASDRLHAFVIAGMRDNQAALAHSAATYYPYVEPEPGAGRGLLAALARHAAAVVTDDYPCFFLPAMVEAAGGALGVCLEAVDSNGVYPMRATDRVFSTAASFRRHLQKQLPEHLMELPAAEPLGALEGTPVQPPATIAERWPPARLDGDIEALVAALPIDHSVAPAPVRGGSVAAAELLDSFVRARLDRYPDERNHPDGDAQSRLSPYLHFGHISAHEVLLRVLERDDWDPGRLADKATGSRNGWWGASAATEAFVDELITWREIGFNRCALDPGYADYETLPGWALDTLASHAGDPRPHLYDLEQFESAATHDELWNAAQRQLVRDGTIHNYLRMLWGKKILEWTPSPRDALAIMIELNNKYALDGRDPNSYSGIFWVLGRYDRAWGPERPIYGKVRYMTSASTARKLRLRDYLARYTA